MSSGNKRKRSDRESEVEGKIIVLIDFGTTYSGIGWVQTHAPDAPELIVQWPYSTSNSVSGMTSYKVPTQLAYDIHGYKWGFQICESEKRHTLFKLCLDPSHDYSTDLAKKYPDPQAAPPGYDYPAERMVADYLIKLREHFERTIRKQMPKSALEKTPIEYIITVPAVWTDTAKDKTRACAEKAGMGISSALHMISEPEAAAIHALQVSAPNDISVGDTFILCDCGGGTCDLISYTILALKPILKIVEASPGSGSLCGGSFLNLRFKEHLEEKYGGQPGWDEDVLEELMDKFERNIKRTFRGTFGEEFIMKVPSMTVDNAKLGVIKKRLCITGEDVRAVFEPVLKEISKLVLDQIKACNKPVKALLLVGGFGSNEYLHDALRQEVKSHNLQVIQPQDSWTSVIRGGLMMGLAANSSSFAKVHISGRSARKHYGLNVGKMFKPCHDSAYRFWSSFHGHFRVATMDWFIHKGQTVTEDRPFRLSYGQTRRVSSGAFRNVKTDVFVCADPMKAGAPKHPEEERITKLVTLTANFDSISAAKVPIVRGANGKKYYNVHYEVQITLNSGDTVYELIYDNVNYGRVSAEYV